MRLDRIAVLIGIVLIVSCQKPINTVPQKDPESSPQPTAFPHPLIFMPRQVDSTIQGRELLIWCEANRRPFSWIISDRSVASLKDLGPIENTTIGLTRYGCLVTTQKPGVIRLTAKSGSLRFQTLIACIDPSLGTKVIESPYYATLKEDLPFPVDGIGKTEIISDSNQWSALWTKRLEYWNLEQGGNPPIPTPPPVDFSKRSVVLAVIEPGFHDNPPLVTHLEIGEPATISIAIPGISGDGLLTPATGYPLSIHLFEIPKVASDSVVLVQRASMTKD
ncbi:MAG TPA: hypothetical protein DD435_02355 [Cyanobacteria bacterium UBA8530]|nr:hypothetical protein [Cyanobacteria bacterium UBA8530]